jgi:hypothetical protein
MSKFWRIETAIVAGAALIAMSIMVTGHYEIATLGYGYGGGDSGSSDVQVVYRLDRWTGAVDYCHARADGNAIVVDCPFKPQQ